MMATWWPNWILVNINKGEIICLSLLPFVRARTALRAPPGTESPKALPEGPSENSNPG